MLSRTIAPTMTSLKEAVHAAMVRAGKSSLKDFELAYMENHVPLVFAVLVVFLMPNLDKTATCLALLLLLPLCEFLWGAFATSVEKEEERKKIMSKTRRPSGPESRLMIDCGFMPEVCCVLHSSYKELVFTDRLDMREAIHIDKTTKKVWREMIEHA